MPNILDFANLSENVYYNQPTAPPGWERVNSKAPIKGITGFFGASYRHLKTKAFVIAFRGSEKPGDDAIRDWVVNDVAILSKMIPIAQVAEAEMFAAKEAGAVQGTVYITGHSLGGALAQIVAGNRKGALGVTFNAPGVRDHLFARTRSWSNGAGVVNIRVDGDPVSAYGQHVGQAPITIGTSGITSAMSGAVQVMNSCMHGLFTGLSTGNPYFAMANATASGMGTAGGLAVDTLKKAGTAHTMGAVFAALHRNPIADRTAEALLR